MLFVIALYFALATLALALLLLPQARAQAVAWAQRLVSGGSATRRRVSAQGQQGASRAARKVGAVTSAGLGWFSARRPWILATFALLVAGPLLALAFAFRGYLAAAGRAHRSGHLRERRAASTQDGEAGVECWVYIQCFAQLKLSRSPYKRAVSAKVKSGQRGRER